MIAQWLGIALSVVSGFGIIFGGLVGYRQIRSTTAADQVRAADALAAKIKDARADDQARYVDKLTEIAGDRDRETARANRAEARADALQTLINTMRLGGNS